MHGKPDMNAALAAITSHPDAFPQARDILAKAAAAAFSAQIKSCDLDGLKAVRAALGGDLFLGLAQGLGKEADGLLKRVDKENAAILTANADSKIEHIASLASDERSPALRRVLKEMDLPALRAARTELGKEFAAWLGSAKDTERKAALKRVDANLPGLSTLKAEGILERLEALTAGAEPFPALDLAHMDHAALVKAHGQIGAKLDSWLSAQKPPALKVAIQRIDPHRPKGEKLTKPEIVLILTDIAKGGERTPAPGSIDEISDNEL